MIDQDAVVGRIMRRLLSPDFTEDDPAWSMIRADAHSKFRAGWPEDEIVAYLRCIENVSPHLPEDVALARMEMIRRRVEGKQF